MKRSLTFLATLLIFSFSGWFLSGCALLEEKKSVERTFAPVERAISGSYDEVWRYTQLALSQYPMRINNMDSGILETEPIPYNSVWNHLTEDANSLKAATYRLQIRLVKGQLKRRPAVKVSIKKEVTLQRDFFASQEKIPSSGLEEESILYRIQREKIIDEALKKAAKKENQRTQENIKQQ